MNWRSWGIWRSFNSPADYVAAGVCLVLILAIVYMLYRVVRPKCGRCGTSGWFFNGRPVVTSGFGPETCDCEWRCEACLKGTK